MLGYKIYFNGDKFVADNAATEVQTMPCDSTVSWMAIAYYSSTKQRNYKSIYRCSFL